MSITNPFSGLLEKDTRTSTAYAPANNAGINTTSISTKDIIDPWAGTLSKSTPTTNSPSSNIVASSPATASKIAAPNVGSAPATSTASSSTAGATMTMYSPTGVATVIPAGMRNQYINGGFSDSPKTTAKTTSTTPITTSTPSTATSTVPVGETASTGVLTSRPAVAEKTAMEKLIEQFQNQYQKSSDETTRRIAEQQAAQEATLRAKFDAQKANLSEQQAQDKASQDVLAYRLGRKDTMYGAGEMQDLQRKQNTEMSALQAQQEGLIEQMKSAVASGEWENFDRLQSSYQKNVDNATKLSAEMRAQQSFDLDTYEKQREATLKDLEMASTVGGDIDPTKLAEIDQTLGFGEGFAQKYLDTQSALSEAKSEEDQFSNMGKVVDMLAKVPENRTINLPGYGSMTGLKEVDFMKGVYRTTEKDDAGNITEVMTRFNPETGESEVLSINNLGQIGTMSKIGADSTGQTQTVKTNDPVKLSKARDVIDSVNNILNSNWEDVVGPIKSKLPTLKGSSADVLASIKTLSSQKLTEILEQGLMKGALSDRDIENLKAASSEIGSAITDNGVKMSPDGFRKALTKIKISTDGATGYENTTIEDYALAYPEKIQSLKDAKAVLDKTVGKGGYDDGDLINYVHNPFSFNSVGGDTKSATLGKVTAAPIGSSGGQCGRFVNKITGLGLGDSYASKMAKMDPGIRSPQPGMVFVTPYKDTGHTGFIVGVDGDEVIVKDSNYRLDEKIATHRMPISKITGLARA